MTIAAARTSTSLTSAPVAAVPALGAFPYDVAQAGDSRALLKSLRDGVAAAVVFDPQHRPVLNYLKFGNERARQRGRAALPAMPDPYSDSCLLESARVLRPSGYVFLWADTYQVGTGAHLRVSSHLKCVDVIAWDNLRMGMGKRSRRRGDYVVVLQRPPITAKNWTDHSIPSRWSEKVDRDRHPHRKPTELLSRLIGAVTQPGDLVVDPAAGSFVVLEICQLLGRRFAGCDLAFSEPIEGGAQ
jgi:site-specific DNA-methyltransferase (adenine-specific)